MASILTYNGISLPLVRTEKYLQEVVYSADGVDSLYTKTTIGVGCVLSPCLFNGMDVADWVRNVRPYLMVRGAQLSFMLDGDYIMQPTVTPTSDSWDLAFDCGYDPSGDQGTASPNYDSAGDDTFQMIADARLGPKPLRFDVRKIEGNTWLAYFEIETYLPYCKASSDTPPYYLSNRWSSLVSVDDEYFMTRTIDGTLIINGQYGNQTTTTGGMKIDVVIQDMVNNSIIIPPCPKRYKRDAIDVTRSSDGLTVNYKIVDKQQYVAMPRPATKIDAQYTETSGTKDFALMNMMVCEISVTVTGEPNNNYDPTGTISGGGDVNWNANGGLDINKYYLMTLMFQVVLSRIPFPFLLSDLTNKIGQDNKYIIQYFQIKEEVFKPKVGCVVKALRPRNWTSQTIGQTLLSNQGVYGFTTVGSCLYVADIINDIARTPDNIGNYGLFLVAAQTLTDNLGSTATPCQIASSLMFPCISSVGRNINTSLSTSMVALGSNNNAPSINYSEIAAQTASANYGAIENTGKYYGDEQVSNPFLEYLIDVQYLTDQHMFQLPVAYDIYSAGTQPASGCVFAQTAAPTTRKVVHWKASRIGDWPMNPLPTDIANGYGPMAAGTGSTIAPTGDQVLSYHVTFADSFLMQDGINRKYETAGVYECGLATRLQWDQPGGIPVCVNPITSDVWEQTFTSPMGSLTASTSIGTATIYPTSKFVSGIIGYTNSTVGPGGINMLGYLG
jgi:hypothetical protein